MNDSSSSVSARYNNYACHVAPCVIILNMMVSIEKLSKSVPSLAQLCDMFPNLKKSAVDLLCNLHGPAEVTDVIISKYPHLVILSALRQKILKTDDEYKMKIDEDDLIADAIAMYKMEKFSLKQPIRVVFSGQPAVDAGGVRRQFFFDTLEKFAFSKDLNLFDGLPTRLHPRPNPQALLSGLFKVLGRIVGHAILLESLGFPYLAPCLYWYFATSSEQIAAGYISVTDDVGIATKDVVQKVGNLNFRSILLFRLFH